MKWGSYFCVVPKPSEYTHANAAVRPPNTWVHYLGTYDGETWPASGGAKVAARYLANPTIQVPVEEKRLPPWQRTYTNIAPLENTK